MDYTIFAKLSLNTLVIDTNGNFLIKLTKTCLTESFTYLNNLIFDKFAYTGLALNSSQCFDTA